MGHCVCGPVDGVLVRVSPDDRWEVSRETAGKFCKRKSVIGVSPSADVESVAAGHLKYAVTYRLPRGINRPGSSVIAVRGHEPGSTRDRSGGQERQHRQGSRNGLRMMNHSRGPSTIHTALA